MRQTKGQQAIEFILISSLILIGSLAVTLTFGDKIANFFEGDSAVAKTAKAKAATIASTSNVAYNQDFKTSYSPIFDTPAMSKYNVIQNTDGSISFTVGTQNVSLPTGVVQLQDTVMQTTGSAGATELIQDIANMINTYKSEFGGTVPLKISFGSGKRNDLMGNNSSYSGSAAANITTISAGKHVIINQKDQSCTADPGTNSCNYSGVYKISGTMNSSGQLSNASVSVVANDKTNYSGTFSGTVSLTNGLKVTNGNFTLDANPNPSVDYTWNIDCTNSANQFNI